MPRSWDPAGRAGVGLYMRMVGRSPEARNWVRAVRHTARRGHVHGSLICRIDEAFEAILGSLTLTADDMPSGSWVG